MQGLQTGDGQAKCGGGPINNVLEGMEIVDGCQHRGTSERVDY